MYIYVNLYLQAIWYILLGLQFISDFIGDFGKNKRPFSKKRRHFKECLKLGCNVATSQITLHNTQNTSI